MLANLLIGALLLTMHDSLTGKYSRENSVDEALRNAVAKKGKSVENKILSMNKLNLLSKKCLILQRY
uniref:Secreted protein n=1 Tax=Loa loa TaxID=7209 RepID=A0A1I7VYB5_LOALO